MSPCASRRERARAGPEGPCGNLENRILRKRIMDGSTSQTDPAATRPSRAGEAAKRTTELYQNQASKRSRPREGPFERRV